MKLLIFTCLTGLVCIAYGQSTEALNYQQALQALTSSKLSAGDMAKLSQQISAAAKTGTPQEIQQKAIDIIRARIAQQAIATTVAPGGAPGQNPMIAAAQKAMQAYQQLKQQQAQSGQAGSDDANTFNIQVQPDQSASSGLDGSSAMGFDPQMLAAIKQKFMAFIKSKNPDTVAMASYYYANYKTEIIKTLLDKFSSFFPKDQQSDIDKMVAQGVANNEKLLDRVEEVAKLDAEFISAAVPILKDTSLTIPEMQEKLQKLTANYEPVIRESIQGLVKPIIIREVVPQMQTAMKLMGGQGTDEVMYADVMPNDNSDQPMSTDVHYDYYQPAVQEEPPVGGKKAAKAAAKAAKKAAKQAARQAAKEAAKKAAKKAEKAAKKAEKAAKKNAE